MLLAYGNKTKMPLTYAFGIVTFNILHVCIEFGDCFVLFCFVLDGWSKRAWSKTLQILRQKAFYFHKEGKIHPSHNYKHWS